MSPGSAATYRPLMVFPSLCFPGCLFEDQLCSPYEICTNGKSNAEATPPQTHHLVPPGAQVGPDPSADRRGRLAGRAVHLAIVPGGEGG